MSAYIMTDDSINNIVNFFANAVRPQDQAYVPMNGRYDYINKNTAEEVARILYAQNVRSVDTRYNEENEAKFTYKPSYQRISNKELVQEMDSLEYQSCETDDYYQTEAYLIICRMRKQLLQEIYAEEEAYEGFNPYTD